jgi:hypothetical protein
MSPVTSGLWALAGAVVVEALELSGEIRRSKGRWPWRGTKLWPSVLAVALRLAASGLLAAAMSAQFADKWAAFTVGIAAPLIVSRLAEQIPVSHIGNRNETDGPVE